jgi:HEAT repeat protein
MVENPDNQKDLHAGHPEAPYRMEQIAEEMKRHKGDIPYLISLLKSPYQLDREKAVDYLGDIGDPEAVPALIEALNDPVISWLAAESLGKIGDKRAVGPLVAVLNSNEKWVRRNAATALGQIRDPAAFEALSSLLTDKKHDVREAAVKALGQLGDERAIKLLSSLANDPDEKVRIAAAASVEHIKQKKPPLKTEVPE